MLEVVAGGWVRGNWDARPRSTRRHRTDGDRISHHSLWSTFSIRGQSRGDGKVIFKREKEEGKTHNSGTKEDG